jgi:hypothetical protein
MTIKGSPVGLTTIRTPEIISRPIAGRTMF